jgi:hypothetical protein
MVLAQLTRLNCETGCYSPKKITIKQARFSQRAFFVY